MSEQIIEDIFDRNSWRGYTIEWCKLCNVWRIACDYCKNSSCNGGSCSLCSKDFDDFMNLKPVPQSHMTEQERNIVRKYFAIKRLLPISITKGFTEFNPRELEDYMSEREAEIFNS